MEEVWKEVKGYELEYSVSNLGNIKSNPKNRLKSGLLHNGKIIKPILDANGYLYCNLYKDGKCKKISVHYIVASTWLCYEKSKELVIDHINNNKKDNNVNNLQIITYRYNTSKDRKNNSGNTGVCYVKSRKKYRSSIRIKDTLISLCSSDNPEKPSEFYKIAVKNISLYNGDNSMFRNIIKDIYNGK